MARCVRCHPALEVGTYVQSPPAHHLTTLARDVAGFTVSAMYATERALVAIRSADHLRVQPRSTSSYRDALLRPIWQDHLEGFVCANPERVRLARIQGSRAQALIVDNSALLRIRWGAGFPSTTPAWLRYGLPHPVYAADPGTLTGFAPWQPPTRTHGELVVLPHASREYEPLVAIDSLLEGERIPLVQVTITDAKQRRHKPVNTSALFVAPTSHDEADLPYPPSATAVPPPSTHFIHHHRFQA